MKIGKILTKKIRTDSTVQVSSHCIIISEAKAIFDILMNCDAHSEFIPNYAGCEITFENADSIYGKTIINPPLSKKNISYFLATKYQFAEEYARISWEMDTSKDHPYYLSNTFGYWEIVKLESDHHIVTFYSDSDFDFNWSINWFLEPILKSAVKNSLPKLLRNLRARVESNEKWLIGHEIPAPLIESK